MATTKITSNVIADDAITSDQLGGDLTMPGHVSLADNKEIRVGTGNDLVIKHTGSHANITNTTGNLTLRGDTVYIANGANSEYMAQFVADGAASLRFNNVEELATVSGGVYVPNKIGIGTNSPARELHVSKASSGATSTSNSVLVVEDDDNTELSILGGSSSVLAINFGHSGDANDAIISYNTSSGSENMAFTVNAAERMRITSAGHVGIADTPPAWGAAYVGLTLGSAGAIWGTRTAANLTVISDNSYHNGSNSIAMNTGLASIYTQTQGKHVFGNFASVSAGATQTEVTRMYISSNGNVTINEALLVGTEAAYDKLAVLRTSTSQTAGMTLINDQAGGYGSGITWESKRSDANNIQTAGRISVQGYNSWNSDSTSSSKMVFSVRHSNTLQDIMTIQGGNLAFASGKGIDFSATGSGTGTSGNAHILDEYEYGSWTPTCNTGSATFVSPYYVKIGRIVHFSFQVHQFSDRTTASSIDLRGLPFPCVVGQAAGTVFGIYLDHEVDSVYVNTAEEIFFYELTNSGWYAARHTDINSSSGYFYVGGSYISTG